MNIIEIQYQLYKEIAVDKGKLFKLKTSDVAGEVTTLAGLKKGTSVVYGGGDQFMQVVGNGIVSKGVVSSNIGTGGQISVMVDKMIYDLKLSTKIFCHIKPNTWNIQGSSLNAGLSLGWLKSNILIEKDFLTLTKMAGEITPGSVMGLSFYLI